MTKTPSRKGPDLAIIIAVPGKGKKGDDAMMPPMGPRGGAPMGPPPSGTYVAPKASRSAPAKKGGKVASKKKMESSKADMRSDKKGGKEGSSKDTKLDMAMLRKLNRK